MTENVQHATVFDSDGQYLGGIYAKALLGVTEKRGVTDQVLEEFQSLIDDVLDKLPAFNQVLASPRIAHEEKTALLDKVFGGRMQRDLLTFLKVVSQHGRMNYLRAILAETRKQYNKLRGRIEVDVETAVPLSESLHSELEQRLRTSLKADISLRTHVNPQLVGGLVVRIGDTVYDGSVADQLRRFQEAALARTRREVRASLGRFAIAQ